MEAGTFNHVVERVLAAKTILEALDISTMDSVESSYKAAIRLIHPDKCKHPKAHDALVKLNSMIEDYRKNAKAEKTGKSYQSDAGIIRYKRKKLYFDDGDVSILSESFKKEKTLWMIANPHLQKYMVSENASTTWHGNLYTGSHEIKKVVFNEEVMPLMNNDYEEHHVRWILSRMLEFILLMHTGPKYVHAGMTPESIFVVPKTHGIIVLLYLHTTRLNAKMSTYSKWYKSWYPDTMFRTKMATPDIDIEMVKKTAVYLLGEHSGNASLLKKRNVSKPLVEFLLSYHNDSVKAYTDYRKMLDKNYEKKFYPLNYSF